MKSSRFPLAVFFIAVAFAWWFYGRPGLITHDPDAGPRPVTTRGDLAGDEKTTIEIFKTASSSVVYITSIEQHREFFSLNVHEIPKGTGSGFIWDDEGRIVTNLHVIADANRVEVTLADQSTWRATFVGAAPDKDLAVLQISAPRAKLRPISVGSSGNLLVGQKVFAIGNPFGLDQTMTTGIVSAIGREIRSFTGRTIRGAIQTDAAINPGNSGGPLLDSAGRLIGINTAIYSPSGASAGIGFAVPVDIINRVVPEVIRYGKPPRPTLGITIADERVAWRMGIQGLLVIDVIVNSNAEAAGIRGTRQEGGRIIYGDIITSLNEEQVATYEDLMDVLNNFNVGDEVSLSVMRGDKAHNISIVLEAAD